MVYTVVLFLHRYSILCGFYVGLNSIVAVAQEEELFEALNRARRVVQSGQSSAHRFEDMAVKAQLEKKQDYEKIEEKNDQTLVFTDTSEFCRIIELADEDKGKDPTDFNPQEAPPLEDTAPSVPREPTVKGNHRWIIQCMLCTHP